MEYDNVSMKKAPEHEKVECKHITNFIIEYIKNNNVGMLSNAWLYQA